MMLQQETTQEQPTYLQENWTSGPLTQIVQRLIRDHRRWRTDHLPSIDHLFDLAQDLPQPRQPVWIAPLRHGFYRLRVEMEGHMCREENVLFPAIVDRERAAATNSPVPRPAFGSLRNPISMMEHEHQTEQQRWADLRAASQGYSLPDDAAPCLRALVERLEVLEKAVFAHSRIENHVLFERAVMMECK